MGRKDSNAQDPRAHRAFARRVSWTVLFLFTFLLTGLAGAPTASAGTPSAVQATEGEGCIYIPVDPFGWRFDAYCRSLRGKGSAENVVRIKNVKNPIATHTRDGEKTKWRTGYQNSDTETGMIRCWDKKPDTAAMQECVDDQMKAWLKVRHEYIRKAAEQGGNYIPERLDNPCDALPKSDERRRLCKSPIGDNPCRFVDEDIRNSNGVSLQEYCAEQHKEFMVEPDGSNEELSSGAPDIENCDFYTGEARDSCERERDPAELVTPSTTKLRMLFNNLLGRVKWFAPGVALLGLGFTGVRGAWAFYHGHPAPREFMRVGWVWGGLLVVTSPGAIAAMVT